MRTPNGDRDVARTGHFLGAANFVGSSADGAAATANVQVALSNWVSAAEDGGADVLCRPAENGGVCHYLTGLASDGVPAVYFFSRKDVHNSSDRFRRLLMTLTVGARRVKGRH